MPAIDLKKQCYDWLYEYGQTFSDVVMSMKIEYSPAVNEVLYRLGLEEKERENLIWSTLFFAEESSKIPYHQLSPLNQFYMSGIPYVFYRLGQELENPSTRKPVEAFLDDDDPRSMQMLYDCGKQVAKRVGGALDKSILGCCKELVMLGLRLLVDVILLPIRIVYCALQILARRSDK